MDLKDYLRREFTYNAWANRETLTAIRAGKDSPPRALTLMSHILSAEILWLERLKGVPQSSPVWPDFDADDCEAEGNKIAALWPDYLAGISAAALSGKIYYRNSKGEAWESVVLDVLTHVVLHSAYHRGQIASLMRAGGQTPAYTDFIHAVRQGMIE